MRNPRPTRRPVAVQDYNFRILRRLYRQSELLDEKSIDSGSGNNITKSERKAKETGFERRRAAFPPAGAS